MRSCWHDLVWIMSIVIPSQEYEQRIESLQRQVDLAQSMISSGSILEGERLLSSSLLAFGEWCEFQFVKAVWFHADNVQWSSEQERVARKAALKWKLHQFTSVRDVLWGNAVFLREANAISIEMNKKASQGAVAKIKDQSAGSIPIRASHWHHVFSASAWSSSSRWAFLLLIFFQITSHFLKKVSFHRRGSLPSFLSLIEDRSRRNSPRHEERRDSLLEFRQTEAAIGRHETLSGVWLLGNARTNQWIVHEWRRMAGCTLPQSSQASS